MTVVDDTVGPVDDVAAATAAADELAAAQAELTAARAELARLRVSAETGIPVALLAGGDDGQIRARADAIVAWARR